MSFNSASLIQLLQELGQQIAAASQHRQSLASALARRDLGEVRRTKIEAECLVLGMTITTGHIKARVVPADGLGDVLESLSELVLRAVRLVLLTELNALRDVVSESSAHRRPPALCPEPFRTINGCLRKELHRISCQWGAYRGMQGVERAAYRAALRAAHASMRELGDASVAARALREGLTCTDWPELQEVCERMLAALAIRIDIDPDTPLLLHACPLHDAAPAGAGSRMVADRVCPEPVAGPSKGGT